MQCELCGNTVPATHPVRVEGILLQLGPECERFGTPLNAPARPKAPLPAHVTAALERRRQRSASKDVFDGAEMARGLVEEFGERIRQARERKGWTRQDLGGRVKEPENAMARIESGTLHPTDATAKRLERELGIVLFETPSAAPAARAPVRGRTLGDFIKRVRKPDE